MLYVYGSNYYIKLKKKKISFREFEKGKNSTTYKI